MDNGKQVFPHSKQKYIVIKKFNDELVAMINESIYHHEEIETYKDDSILEPVKERKQSQYKPGLTHPWKKNFMMITLTFGVKIYKIIMLMIANLFVKMQSE